MYYDKYFPISIHFKRFLLPMGYSNKPLGLGSTQRLHAQLSVIRFHLELQYISNKERGTYLVLPGYGHRTSVKFAIECIVTGV